MKNRNNQRNIRRNKLSFRIAFLAVLTSLLAIVGIEVIRYSTQNIINEYNRIVEEDYIDMELMNAVLKLAYEHQSTAYRHTIETDPEKKADIEDGADRIKKEIQTSMASLEINVKGTEYEKSYHQIYSDVTGYFQNVKTIFDFSRDNDAETANYYMDTTLLPILGRMNTEIKSFDSRISEDIAKVREQMRKSTTFIRNLALGVMAILVVMTIISVILCVHISREMVSHDMLTGLANFDTLIKVGTKYKKKNKLARYNGLAVSIRDFKYINQEYGSLVGDVVIKEYAHTLSSYMIKGEIIARNGGDNFIALIEQERVKGFLELIEHMRVDIDGRMELPISSRCGIYDISEDDSIHDVVSAGLIALGDSRLATTENFVWFHEENRNEMLRQKEILTGYKKAISEEEFVVYYQPKVDIASGRLYGCEALVRWIKDGNLVPPNSFVPVLEDDGKIQELDFYVFDRVCRDIKDWLSRGIEPVRISTNFSKLHLHNKGFVSDVKDVIERYGVDTKYLEAELTESSGYEDYEALLRFVEEMRKIGVHTSMDDFGTGYSSLSLLKDIEMDVVKLDRSFLRNIESDDERDRKLVENIVKMIHDLKRHVICEGVETVMQAGFLLNIGCHTAQGFLYDRPLPHDEFEDRLNNPEYDVSFG